MEDEIKEILQDFQKIAKGEYYPDDLLDCENCQKLLDYITNLQEEIKNLKKLYNEYKEEQDNVFKMWNTKMEETTCYKDFLIYKSRNEKALELVNEMLKDAYIDGKYIMYNYSTNEILEIEKILDGDK